MTENKTNAAGETQMLTRDTLRQITVADLLAVSLIAATAIIAFRNIPGLLANHHPAALAAGSLQCATR